MTPNPSIERTATGRPTSAAHVKRLVATRGVEMPQLPWSKAVDIIEPHVVRISTPLMQCEEHRIWWSATTVNLLGGAALRSMLC